MSRMKQIENAALVIDGRVEALKREGEEFGYGPGDRSAIAEAELLARMIRRLKQGPYRDPYKAAMERSDD